MKEFFDFDQHAGIRTDFEQDGDITVVNRTQSVGLLIDHIRALRNEGITDAKGKKNEGLTMVASIPCVVQLELIKKGFNFPPKDEPEWKRMMKFVRSEYPYLMTTDKRVA